MKINHNIALFIWLIIASYTASCVNILGDDFWGEDETWYGFETEILRVDIDPNPVVAGELVTFTCVINDSLDPNFYYIWIINIDSVKQDRTETNTYEIKAPNQPGNYSARVYMSNNKPNYSAVSENFSYTVIRKQN